MISRWKCLAGFPYKAPSLVNGLSKKPFLPDSNTFTVDLGLVPAVESSCREKSPQKTTLVPENVPGGNVL